MFLFHGTHLSKLDAKGRVSVPADFRAALKRLEGKVELVFLPSAAEACIEVWPAPAFADLEERMARMDPFSQEYDYLAAAFFGRQRRGEPDGEGRLVLPAAFVAHANLAGAVAFVGKGKRFEIWEPEAGERHLDEANLRFRAAKAGPARVAQGVGA